MQVDKPFLHFLGILQIVIYNPVQSDFIKTSPRLYQETVGKGASALTSSYYMKYTPYPVSLNQSKRNMQALSAIQRRIVAE